MADKIPVRATFSGSVVIGLQEYEPTDTVGISFGGTGADNAPDARINLGLEIGVDVQAWDAQLDDIAALTPTKGNLIVGDGTNWISLGVGTDTQVLTADSAQASGIKWGAAGGGGGPTFEDDVFRILDNVDTSKEIAFQASGITTSTTRTITMPDADVDLGLVLTALQNVVEDTTPQLGGDLDVNGNMIVSTAAGDIEIIPDTTGDLVLDGLNWPQADGLSGQVLTTDGAGQLSFTSAGTGSTFEDDVFRILDNVDNTKEIAFQASGITTSTTRTITMPDADVDLGLVLTALQDVVDDTTPQLGGDLDVNGNMITGAVVMIESTGAGDIEITPDTTGNVVLDGLNWPQADGTSGQAIITDGAGQLSFSTIVSDSYGTVTGDSGSATASGSDTLNFTGVGITTTAADGAPDSVTFTLDISDLTAGVGPLVLADEIAVNDGGTTLRFTFTDVVEDLDIPNAITVNGLVTRTAADTYASRTITASTTAAEEGITVTDGDGVAGNPTIGVDINGQTNSADDLASTDELLAYDGTNNVSMSGAQISDGVATQLGISTLTLSTINGQPVFTFEDSTRANKRLSIETTTFAWSEKNIGNDDWIEVGNAGDAAIGYIMPHTCTIVKATGMTADNQGNSKDIDLYVDDVLDTASIISFSGGAGEDEDSDVTLNIDVSAGEKIQLRGDAAGGSIKDTVITLFVKWRV